MQIVFKIFDAELFEFRTFARHIAVPLHASVLYKLLVHFLPMIRVTVKHKANVLKFFGALGGHGRRLALVEELHVISLALDPQAKFTIVLVAARYLTVTVSGLEVN